MFRVQRTVFSTYAVIKDDREWTIKRTYKAYPVARFIAALRNICTLKFYKRA